jgi:hypothetical protein
VLSYKISRCTNISSIIVIKLEVKYGFDVLAAKLMKSAVFATWCRVISFKDTELSDKVPASICRETDGMFFALYYVSSINLQCIPQIIPLPFPKFGLAFDAACILSKI